MRINTGSRRFYIFLFIIAVSLTFGIRSLIYYREAGAIKKLTGSDFVPFLVESAIMYDYAQQVANGKSIGGSDTRLGGGLDNIPVENQMLLGLEYFLGWGYRAKTFLTGKPKLNPNQTLYEDNPDFTDCARFQIRFWISLTGGLILLWLLLMRVPWLWAMAGTVFYAVSPAAVARYTGQDLVRGEFCMPFIIGCLVLAAWIMRRPQGFKYLLLCACTLAAFAFWDAPQFFFTFWAGLEMLRMLIGGKVSRKRCNLWLAVYIGIVLAALLIPYQRYHGLLASPIVIVIMPLLVLMMFSANRLKTSTRWGLFIAGLAVLTGIWKILPGYGQNYSHFGELIKAKLAFYNVKPRNPELLSFDARILWTPAMHSAEVMTTFFYYPVMLWMMALTAVIMMFFRRTREQLRRSLPRDGVIYAFAVIFTGMYVFFVRAHVFSIIFLSMSLGLLLDAWWRTQRQSGWKNLRTLAIMTLLCLCLFLEMTATFMLSRTYATNYFAETAGLIKWFRASNLKDVTVLADMNLSPILKGYCGTRIITQPQFELKATRDLVHDYIMHLYHSREDEFAALCEQYGVDLVVFDRCNSYEVPMHIYTNRYMANAKKIKSYAPAWVMEKYPKTMRYFHLISPPPGLEYISKTYYVFRYVSPQQLEKAEKSAELAEYFFYSGKKDLARKMAQAAYAQAPNLDKAYLAYYKIFGKIPDDSLRYLGRMRRLSTEDKGGANQ